MNYSALLSIHFFLIVACSWTESKFRRYETLFHFIAIGPPFVMGAILLVKEMFNTTLTQCWIQSHPMDCESNDELTCIRGGSGNIALIRIMCSVLPVTLAFIAIAISMILLNLAVLKIERRAESLRSHASNSVHRRMARKVFSQSCRYVGAFMAVWISALGQIIAQKTTGATFTSHLIFSTFFPLQGKSSSLRRKRFYATAVQTVKVKSRARGCITYMV